jgi:cytochrome P450
LSNRTRAYFSAHENSHATDNFLQIFLAVAAKCIYNAFFHPLAKVPGPRIYAASTLPYIVGLLSGHWPFIVKKLHDVHGPAVRFTPHDVSYITPTAWHTIYGHKKTGQLSFQKDKRLYRSSLTAADNILLANDVDHSRQRRLLSHAFSEKALRSQEDILNGYLNLLISKLAVESESKRVANMVQWYNFTTFDIIGDLAFGEPFGCLEAGGYHPWVAKLFDGFRLAVFNQAIRRLPIVAPLLRQFIPRSLITSQVDHLRLSFEKAKKRLESGRTDRDDFMTYILRYNDEKGMTIDEIGENSNILILAGSETTATLLSGTTYWLLRNPKIYQTLVQEIRSTFMKEEEINSISVNNLKYLLAVLNEGLRIYPPSPGGLGRISPPGGSTVDGYWMPEGVSEEFGLSCILMTDTI